MKLRDGDARGIQRNESPFERTSMKTFKLQSIPEDLYQKLKAAATVSGRSISEEALYRLKTQYELNRTEAGKKSSNEVEEKTTISKRA